MHLHYIVGRCLDFNVPSTAEGYLRMNHTLIIHLHCSKQATKLQLCQIHCENIHLTSIYQCRIIF